MSFVDALLPVNCVLCGQFGCSICRNCSAKVLCDMAETCHICNSLSAHHKVCHNCKRKSSLTSLRYLSFYVSPIKEIIIFGKQQPHKDVFKELGKLLGGKLAGLEVDCVVALPTASRRIRHRGFDQSVIIGREVSRCLQRPLYSTLIRIGRHKQMGANRKTRLEQMSAKNLYVIQPSLIKNSNILLIDDVVSTGASMEAAAQLLKANGARRIYGACLAYNRVQAN